MRDNRVSVATTEPAGSMGAFEHRTTKRWPARGFTLVELLVVVSIIALLISILLPSLQNAREQAKLLKCLAHCRGMGQAGLVFSGEHDGRMQLAADPAAVERADGGHSRFAYDENDEILAWPVAMALAAGFEGLQHNWDWGVRADNWEDAKSRKNFISDDFELAICPSDRVQISTPFYPTGNSLRPLPSVEPALPDGARYWGYLSYGINEDIVGAEDNNGNPNAPDCWKASDEHSNGCLGQLMTCAGKRLEGNLDRVYDPGTVLLVADSGPDTEIEARESSDLFANLIHTAQTGGPDLQDFFRKRDERIPVKRHPDSKINVLFADFHGGTVKPTQFISSDVQPKIPAAYNTRVRVSPYRPFPK